MVIYGIGSKETSRDQGGYWEYEAITPIGAYNSGALPKFFTNKEDAEKYLEETGTFLRFVVELELVDD